MRSVRHEVELGRVVVPVLDDGPADAPVVALLPGLTDALLPWTHPGVDVPAPPGLGGLRVLRVSYPHPAPADTVALADRLAGALAALGVGPAHLFGHSTGAMVGLHLAARHPDRVASLLATAVAATAGPALRRTLVRWRALVADGDLAGAMTDAARVAQPGGDGVVRPVEPPPWLRADGPTTARFAALAAAVAGHDARDALARVRAPVRVVAGGRDVLCPPSDGAVVAAGVPHASFEVWADEGHTLVEAAPRHLADHVVRRVQALSGLDRGARRPGVVSARRQDDADACAAQLR